MEIPINVAESLIIALFIILVVFATLVALNIIITIFTKILEKLSDRDTLRN